MASAREIALEVLPHFVNSVLARCVHSYGYYASASGRVPEKDAVSMGPAFHAIGAACVFFGVPVAPLFFVERADGEARTIFESDPLEARDVLPHYDILYVAAREHSYKVEEFEKVERLLRKNAPMDWSPHFLWHVTIVNKPKGQEKTYFELALEHYKSIIDEKRKHKQK